MANKQQEPSKAEVQSTELNKLPDGERDTEVSAEAAAEAFENNAQPSSDQE
jgi:hypothetical protein